MDKAMICPGCHMRTCGGQCMQNALAPVSQPSQTAVEIARAIESLPMERKEYGYSKDLAHVTTLIQAALDKVLAECLGVVNDYAEKMEAAMKRPHPVTGRGNHIAECKADAARDIETRILRLAARNKEGEK